MIARVAAPFLGGKGKTVKPSELMSWPKEEEQEATFEEIAMTLKSMATKNKKVK